MERAAANKGFFTVNKNLIYSYDSPSVSLIVKVRNKIAGLVDRTSILRQFLHDNNISIDQVDSKSVTRNKYIIRSQHSDYLAKIRDRALLREATRPYKMRKELQRLLSSTQDILAEESMRLTALNEEYKTIKNKLDNKSLSLLQKAHLQGDKGTLEASIKNQRSTVLGLKQNILEYEKQLKENWKIFNKYYQELKNAYDMVLNSYVKTAGRKLNSVGFTFYDSIMRDIDPDIYKQIKEMIDGK